MALRLAQSGNDVIITYNSKADEAGAVVSEIQKTGRKAAALQLNVGKSDTFDAFALQLKKLLKDEFQAERFDHLVNNGGHGLSVPSFLETTEAQFDDLVDVHFKGTFFLTQKLVPSINDYGSIVNISSGLTRVSFPGSGAYGSVKSAVETLTRYFARELGSRFIRANVVAPGAIATDFNGGRLRNTPQVQEHVKNVTALPRIGQADDIGGVVAFLCSNDAKWVNGQRIEASGGMML
jgi:NAD(P)-dependent dehydrogenase (short-subunit alcohol dehydrogenase family)